MTLWFFATPIIYPMQQAPEDYRWVLNLNPMTHLAISYQEVLFYIGPHGHWKWLMALLARRCRRASVFLRRAYFVFDRLRDSFAEEVLTCHDPRDRSSSTSPRSTAATRGRSSSRRSSRRCSRAA